MSLLPARVAGYQRHRMHHPERIWAETSCALDLWVEILHSLGLDPDAAGAHTLSADMRGDQWLFLKYPIEDLHRLYGITIDELTVWRPMLDHVVAQTEAGALLTIEVDSWYLPDTAGVAYRQAHSKSTIVPNEVDLAARRLGYFHNSGYHELSGEDFEGVFRTGEPADSPLLPGYVEVVDVGGAHGVDPAVAAQLAREHLARRAPGNPIRRLATRLCADLPWLAQQDIETFHSYSFATVRQCGATAEVAAQFLTWLGAHGESGLLAAATAFTEVAQLAKTLQFQLARASRGRAVTLDATLDEMAERWDDAMSDVVSWAG